MARMQRLPVLLRPPASCSPATPCLLTNREKPERVSVSATPRLRSLLRISLAGGHRRLAVHLRSQARRHCDCRDRWLRGGRRVSPTQCYPRLSLARTNVTFTKVATSPHSSEWVRISSRPRSPAWRPEPNALPFCSCGVVLALPCHFVRQDTYNAGHLV